MVSSGQTCLLWEDLWNGQIRKLQFPELHSYAKNKLISLSKAHGAAALHDLFNLPVSVEAYTQLQDLQFEFSTLVLTEENDNWTYIWGSAQFSSFRAYKALTGHSQVEPVFKGL